MSFFDQLDVLDLGFESTNLELLGLHLTLVALKALRIIAHLFLDLIKLLHVLVDLLREILNFVANAHKLLLLSICFFDCLVNSALDGGLKFLLDVKNHLLMIVHLLSVVCLLQSVFIDSFLYLGPQFSVFIDLSLALRLLMIKFYLNFLHLLVEISSESQTFLALLFEH